MPETPVSSQSETAAATLVTPSLLRGWPLPSSGALASLLGSETVLHMGPIIPDTHFEVLRPRAMDLGPK